MKHFLLIVIGALITMVVLLMAGPRTSSPVWEIAPAVTEVGRTTNVGFQVGFVSDPVRDSLSKIWDDTKDPNQFERIYCVHYTAITDGGITEYTVDGILPTQAVAGTSTPTVSTIHCPDSWTALDRDINASVLSGVEIRNGVSTIHTHPPTTCDKTNKNCVFGGQLAWECFPSVGDLRFAARMNRTFEVIQCDRNAFVFFGFSQLLRVPQGWVEPGP